MYTPNHFQFKDNAEENCLYGLINVKQNERI